MENSENVLKFVSPNIIHIDLKNPRGESEDEILNDNDFKRLRISIKDVGVIVPIVVRPKIDIQDHFYLIDGERRLRASIAENIEKVPIRIVKNEVDGRIIAYQIHMHRKDWTRNTEAKAIMSIIKEEFQDLSLNDEGLKRKLVEITKHTPKEIQDFLNLFKYEQEIQDLVINNPRKYPISYIDQIEASFISPLKRYYTNVYTEYGEIELRKIMGYKFKKNLLVKTRYLMDTFNSVFQSTENKAQIEVILISFLANKDKNIADSYKEFKLIGKVVTTDKSSSEKSSDIVSDKGKTDSEKVSTVKSKEPETGSIKNETEGKKGNDLPKEDSLYAPIKLSQQQQTSIIDIKKKYERISKTYSEEELKYIEEAMACLNHGCLKAATLMIWASGISRILNFINKDIAKFNESAFKMKENKKMFYKHYFTNFDKAITEIDELRISSQDLQIICYLYFLSIIDKTQCDKLRLNYQIRCNCAHPTEVILTPNGVIDLFEIIFDYVFNNSKLK